jgi:hypothetical protein
MKLREYIQENLDVLSLMEYNKEKNINLTTLDGIEINKEMYAIRAFVEYVLPNALIKSNNRYGDFLYPRKTARKRHLRFNEFSIREIKGEFIYGYRDGNYEREMTTLNGLIEKLFNNEEIEFEI